MTRFAACLAETLKWEGGWSNHPNDKGGPTMRGVIQRVYDAWRDAQHLPRQTVHNITDDELQTIYRENYWNLVRGDDLPPGVDLAVFDFGVNSGPARAVRYLQMCLGVTQDGQPGPVTLEAARKTDAVALVKQLMEARRKFLRGLPDARYFGEGWQNRCNGIEPAALKMITAQDVPVVAVPLADENAQSATQGRATHEKPPVSSKTVATVATTTTAVAIETGKALVDGPPPYVTETVGNVVAWQTAGKAIVGIASTAWQAPVVMGVVLTLALAAIWAPRIGAWIGRRA